MKSAESIYSSKLQMNQEMINNNYEGLNTI